MREKIINELYLIEKDENIKILFAVESGSRAWGFPSRDSDYDVRFVYIHPAEWYLSIDDKKDVLEYPISDLLDISGWDIRKALNLFKKSNPPLMEWLRSPTMYLEQYSFLNALRELSSQYFSPKASIYHYLHMAEGNYREYLKGEEVRIKKYFYVLRPVLACMWLENNKTMAPMEFETLLETQVKDQGLYNEVNKLLQRKRSGEELDIEPRIDVISDFLEEKMQYYKEYAKGIEDKEQGEIDILNKLFRQTLIEVYDSDIKIY